MINEQQQPQDYLLEVQKLMSSDVVSTYWSHNMDLLVIVTADNLLELYRINFKAQKVFQIQQDKLITSVNFSPDSQYIAYGMNDGQIKVLKTQNGQSLLTVSDPINQQIHSFSFIEWGKYRLQKIFPFKESSIMQKLILQISPHKNCSKQSIVKINYFNELTNDDVFTLLLSSSQRHTSIYLNGFITLAQINYEMISAKQFKNNSYDVYYSYFNTQTQQIQSILVENTSNKYIIHHVVFESLLLKQLQNDIIKFNCLLSYVSEIISFVQLSYPSAQLLLREILRQYNSKMNLIDDPQLQNINPCTQLYKYLNCGITSSSLMNFLTKQIYDTKVLQKLDEGLNTIFNGLHQLFLESIQNSLERAYLLVKELKNLAQMDNENQRNINNNSNSSGSSGRSGSDKIFCGGVKASQLRKIQERIQKLYTMGEIFLVQSTQAKFDIRNLLVWLNKATIKTSSDPNAQIQNTKSYLSRYTVDFTRLHKFLQTQDSFKLQNLLSFFSKGAQSFQMNIPPCQFRLLHLINNKDPHNNPQYIKKTKQIQKLLQLQDIDLYDKANSKMQIQLSYKSFKLQLKNLKQEWKILKVKPIIQISKQLQSKYKIRKVAEVGASQLFMFDLKILLKKNEQTNQDQLLLYYIEPSTQKFNPNIKQKLIQYNTISKQYRYIAIPTIYQPISLSIGADVILLIQNTSQLNEQSSRSIVQVVNEQWQGEELTIGKRINNLNGDIIINSGLRGLNLMIINKNKLVVFD